MGDIDGDSTTFTNATIEKKVGENYVKLQDDGTTFGLEIGTYRFAGNAFDGTEYSSKQNSPDFVVNNTLPTLGSIEFNKEPATNELITIIPIGLIDPDKNQNPTVNYNILKLNGTEWADTGITSNPFTVTETGTYQVVGTPFDGIGNGIPKNKEFSVYGNSAVNDWKNINRN